VHIEAEWLVPERVQRFGGQRTVLGNRITVELN
jgi:hypothetical protein